MKTFIFYHCHPGNEDMLKIVIDNGADVNAQGRIGERDTALYKSVARGKCIDCLTV